MKTQLLCETASFIAIYAPAASDKATEPGPPVITFPHLSLQISGLRFWGDAMLARAGVSAIGLMRKHRHWFIREEMSQLLPALLPIVARHKPHRIITLGFSMGATPALMHGRTLGTDLTAAFSPHYSIDPAIIGSFDKRRFC